MAYQPPQPASSRLINWGHSWDAASPYPYGLSNVWNQGALGLPSNGQQWTNTLRDALGIGAPGSSYKTYTVPGPTAGGSVTTFLDYMPDDGTIDAVWYIPASGMTGVANGRTIGLSLTQWSGTATAFATVQFNAGKNLYTNGAYSLFNINNYNNSMGGIGDNYGAGPVAAGVQTVFSPYVAALISSNPSFVANTNAVLSWSSTKNAGTQTDPGGVVLIRFGTRYRNYAVGGSALLNPYSLAGSWWTPFSWSPWSRPNAPEVNVTTGVTVGGATSTFTGTPGTLASLGTSLTVASAASATAAGAGTIVTNNGVHSFTYTGGGSGAGPLTGVTFNGTLTDTVAANAVVIFSTTLTVTSLSYPIWNINYIIFNGGAVQVLGNGIYGVASAGTSIIVIPATTSVVIAAGDQGHYSITNGPVGGYESLSPTGINVFVTGLNDADSLTQDVPAWTEAARAVIARVCCPVLNYPSNGNYSFTNGGGTWAAVTPVAGGALPYIIDSQGVSTMEMWTGTVSGAPKVDIRVGPAFEGGTIDLFLLGLSGTGFGVAGSITVDGATPPQGTVTFNTSGVSTSTLISKTVTGTITASSTAVVGTGTNFNQSDLGKVLIPASGTYPAGVIITGFTDATHVTVSAAITVTGVACSLQAYVPMVKRITGLAAGAHKITATITGSDSVANSVLYLYGTGLESNNVKTPVVWANIARTAGQNTTQKANAAALNVASAAVIAGTATALTGNSAEPALGSNVQYVDIDTLMNAQAKYFNNDGIHPNSLGHRLLARTFFSAIRNNFSPDQLMAR